jgi:hypothetical protein
MMRKRKTGEMEIQFEVFDVYGRRVFCSKETWINKFCVLHGFKLEDEHLVKRAINDPENGYPRLDKDFDNRRVYYRKSPTEDYYAKVVVVFYKNQGGMEFGEVITGYMPDKMDKKEKREKRP